MGPVYSTPDSINSTASFPTESFGTINNSANFTQPYKQNTGVTRGTQTIANTDGSKITLGKIEGQTTYGIAFYDSSGNLLFSQVGSTNTTYTPQGVKAIDQGLLPTGDYGTAYYDSNGNLIQKIVNGTTYTYDPKNNYTNIMQSGLLPDGSGGLVVAKPGIAVSTLFS